LRWLSINSKNIISSINKSHPTKISYYPCPIAFFKYCPELMDKATKIRKKYVPINVLEEVSTPKLMFENAKYARKIAAVNTSIILHFPRFLMTL
jgi:hypothetical protein